VEIFIFSGYLGRDPEQRFTQDGTPVTNFSVAVDRSYKNQEGEKVKETVWYRVSAWRRLAETCNQYLKKGRQVIVTGTLSGDKVEGSGGVSIVPRVYEASDGSHRSSFEVTARNVEFIGGRGGDVAEEEIEPESIPFD